MGTAGGEHWIGMLIRDAINGYSGYKYKKHMYLAGIPVNELEVGVKVYSGSVLRMVWGVRVVCAV